MDPWTGHLVPTVRDRGGPGTGGGSGVPGSTRGPSRQGRSGSRRGWFRRVEVLRCPYQGGPGLGAHGGPAVQEHQQESGEAPRPHRRVEPRAGGGRDRVAWQPRRQGAGHYGKYPAKLHETAEGEGGASAGRAGLRLGGRGFGWAGRAGGG